MKNHAAIADEVLRTVDISDFTAFQIATEGQRMRDPKSIDFKTLRLTEEAGEVAGVVKRASFAVMGQPLIGKRSIVRSEREKLADEMGDVLHALAQLANAAGLSLADIAAKSLDKQRLF